MSNVLQLLCSVKAKQFFFRTSCKGRKLSPYQNSGQILLVYHIAFCGQRQMLPEGNSLCLKMGPQGEINQLPEELAFVSDFRDNVGGIFVGYIPTLLTFKPLDI